MIRRDLEKAYVDTYKKRIEAVWRFTNSSNSADNSFMEDVTNEDEVNATDNEEKTENVVNENSNAEI